MSSRAGWNGFAGRIWPADRSLETPALRYTVAVEQGAPPHHHYIIKTCESKILQINHFNRKTSNIVHILLRCFTSHRELHTVRCFTSHREPGAYRGQMGPGARNKSGAPTFEPKGFRKQMYCIE